MGRRESARGSRADLVLGGFSLVLLGLLALGVVAYAITEAARLFGV